MIKQIEYKVEQGLPKALKRKQIEYNQLNSLVQEIFQKVEKEGDSALNYYSKKFDGVNLFDFLLTDEEKNTAKQQLSKELKQAIYIAKNNIQKFHATQLQKKQVVETMPGVKCWSEQRGIEKVGLYIPGGTAPLFSTVLMLGVPAKLANCKEIILCSPPDSNGNIHPAIAYAAQLVGIDKIFKIGGIQAIAALTIGTESIPGVHKLFGPGNQYVTAAKQYAQQKGIAIDMPAGPSEVLIIADENANADFVASDLLSQAEHGTDSQSVLVTNCSQFAKQVQLAIETQITQLPRKEIILEALKNSAIVITESLEKCFDISNKYAPEHLILALQNAESFTEKVLNAGSVFLGKYSCESIGDYASGTNHTLPTNGFAKSYSGISVASFSKKISFQTVSDQGLQNIGPVVEVMAKAEQLMAHKEAVSIRLKTLQL